MGAAKTRNNGRYNGNGREWGTPPEVFDPLHEEFGFTLDACASAANAKCPRYYDEAADGLARSWAGECVWMNPPYGREVYAWTRKAREECERGVLVVGLLPASTDLAWWHDDVLRGWAEVRYVRGRVRFLTGGPYRASGFFASVVVVWRPALCVGCGRLVEVARRCYAHPTCYGCLPPPPPLPVCTPGGIVQDADPASGGALHCSSPTTQPLGSPRGSHPR